MFRLAWWRKCYTPDLCFVLCDISCHPVPSTRSVCDDFASSQHHPVMICIGLHVSLIWSLPNPRWNLQSVNQFCYIAIIEDSITWILPSPAHWHCFLGLLILALKLNITRGFRKSIHSLLDRREQSTIPAISSQQKPPNCNGIACIFKLSKKKKVVWNHEGVWLHKGKPQSLETPPSCR